MPVQTYVCGVIAGVAGLCGLLESVAAIYWRRRAGHWHAFRVAGVLLSAAVAALFTGLAFT